MFTVGIIRSADDGRYSTTYYTCRYFQMHHTPSGDDYMILYGFNGTDEDDARIEFPDGESTSVYVMNSQGKTIHTFRKHKD